MTANDYLLYGGRQLIYLAFSTHHKLHFATFTSNISNFQNNTDHLIILQLWKRYIDDGRFIIDLDGLQICDDNIHLYFNHFIESLKNIYPPNIKLECEYGTDQTFLDTTTNINVLNRNIITKIHEKPLSKHVYLHQKSNNPEDHKKAIFISMLFWGLCLNDRYKDFYDFKIKFILSLGLISWHAMLNVAI